MPCNVRRTVESARGRTGVARAVETDKSPVRKTEAVNFMVEIGCVDF